MDASATFWEFTTESHIDKYVGRRQKGGTKMSTEDKEL